MSAKKKLELELDISVMRLRCTVDTRDKSDEEKFSSKFWFEGEGWRLSYLYYPGDECQYNLLLTSCSGLITNRLHVSVEVESAEKDRIARVLSQERRLTDSTYYYIWEKSEEEILAALPEFRLYGVLKFVVVLKKKETNSYCKSCFAELTLTTEASQAESAKPIADMEPDVFQLFLRYVYSGQLPQLTVDLALSLYETADQYEVQGLAKRCSHFLVRHLTVQNACHVLAVADAHSAKDFKEAVVRFVLQKEIPLSGEHWDDFCRDHSDLANEVLNRFCQKQSKMMKALKAESPDLGQSKIPSQRTRQQPIRRSVTHSRKRKADEI